MYRLTDLPAIGWLSGGADKDTTPPNLQPQSEVQTVAREQLGTTVEAGSSCLVGLRDAFGIQGEKDIFPLWVGGLPADEAAADAGAAALSLSLTPSTSPPPRSPLKPGLSRLHSHISAADLSPHSPSRALSGPSKACSATSADKSSPVQADGAAASAAPLQPVGPCPRSTRPCVPRPCLIC